VVTCVLISNPCTITHFDNVHIGSTLQSINRRFPTRMPLFPRRRFSNIQLSCKDPLLPLHFAMFRSTTLDIRASGLGKVGYLGYTGSVQLPSDMSLLTPSWIDRLLTKKVWLSYTSLYRYIISRKREQEQDSATSQVTRSGCQTARSSAIHPSVIYPSPSAAAFFVSSRKNVIKKTPRNRLSPSQKLKPSRLLPWTRSHLKAKWGKFPTPPISTRCDPSSLDNSYEEKDEFFRSFLFFPLPSPVSAASADFARCIMFFKASTRKRLRCAEQKDQLQQTTTKNTRSLTVFPLESRRLGLLRHARTGLDFVPYVCAAVLAFHFDRAPPALVVHLRAGVCRRGAAVGALLAVLRHHRRSGHVCLRRRWCAHSAWHLAG
jgi:hypothetical protein